MSLPDNVIQGHFEPRRSEGVYTCNCDSQHFILYEDGLIECRRCKLTHKLLRWVQMDGEQDHNRLDNDRIVLFKPQEEA